TQDNVLYAVFLCRIKAPNFTNGLSPPLVKLGANTPSQEQSSCAVCWHLFFVRECKIIEMKNYKQAPLPFQGQKRRFINDFTAALKNYPENTVYVDQFGGSGLLSHTVKQY